MFAGTTVIQSAFTFRDFSEYAIFAVLLVAGVIIARKGKNKFVKAMGIILAITGGGALLWLIGWQIVIRLFLI